MSNKPDLKKIVVNLDLGIAGVSFALLVIFTFLGVIMRYFFRRPFTWLEEVQVGLFLWVAFFGGVAAFRTHGHVSISSLYDVLPWRGKLIDSLFVMVVTVVVIGYLGLKSLSQVKMFVTTHKATSVLGIPEAFIYGIVPLCCLLMIVNYLCVAIPEIRKMVREKGASAQSPSTTNKEEEK